MTKSVGNDRIMQKPCGGLAPALLVVDQDAADLESYSALLCDEGFEVWASTSYADALNWLGTRRFDFIIISQGTQNFEGRPVLGRAVELDRRIPVVVLAPSLDMECYLEAMQMGAIDYFEKPVAPPELVRLIKAHLPARANAASASSPRGRAAGSGPPMP